MFAKMYFFFFNPQKGPDDGGGGGGLRVIRITYYFEKRVAEDVFTVLQGHIARSLKIGNRSQLFDPRPFWMGGGGKRGNGRKVRGRVRVGNLKRRGTFLCLWVFLHFFSVFFSLYFPASAVIMRIFLFLSLFALYKHTAPTLSPRCLCSRSVSLTLSLFLLRRFSPVAGRRSFSDGLPDGGPRACSCAVDDPAASAFVSCAG